MVEGGGPGVNLYVRMVVREAGGRETANNAACSRVVRRCGRTGDPTPANAGRGAGARVAPGHFQGLARQLTP